MLKLLTVIGARPQIIKASAISRAIRMNFSDHFTEVIVHTGQHYDENMSAVFFNELQIPNPAYNLQVGSGKHGEQTARMITGIEEILEKEKPDYIVLYGDTNSTLAGALAASKMHVPIVHIEAGLRSYNKQMPEEINRILTDHLSTYLFPPTKSGVDNLVKEGFRPDNQSPYSMDNPGVFNVGDIMYDNSLYFSMIAAKKTNILERLQLNTQEFVLATVHRNTNTDNALRLNNIVESLIKISEKNNIRVVLPLHPRTAKQIDLLLNSSLINLLRKNPLLLIVPPLSFLEMTALEENAALIITDSGGVQKEAYFYKKPCIILRAETEWIEIVENGAALLCDANPEKIMAAYQYFKQKIIFPISSSYGKGNAAVLILKSIVENHKNTAR